MDNNLNVRKLYIDTIYKLDPYGSNTKFTIEFPQTIECPGNTVMYVDEVVLPNTITTVQQGVNDELYYVIFQSPKAISQGYSQGEELHTTSLC